MNWTTNRFTRYVAARQTRNDRALLNHERGPRIRLWAVSIGTWAIAVTAWTLNGTTDNTGTFASITSVTVGVYLGLTALGPLRRASAYRFGWLDGRGAMVRSLNEAVKRGMSPGEWLEGELTRDLSMLGMTRDEARVLFHRDDDD